MGTGPLQFTMELDIPPGIVTDDTPYSTKGRWADCDGIRWRLGKPETLPGSTQAFGGGSALSGGIATGFGFAAVKLIVGMQTKLYALNIPGTSSTDLTPSPAPSGASGWSLANWGATTLLAAPAGGKLYQSNTSVAATHVATAPANIGKMLVTPQRQVLALSCNPEAGGSQDVRCIRGSDLEDFSTWTTSATNNAFEHILDDPSGIISGDLIADYLMVWTATSLFLGTFVGDPNQTYRFDRVDGGAGLLSRDAYCIHGGVAYWLAPDHNIYRWTPGGTVDKLPCPIWRDFTLNYAGGGPPFMYALPRYNEIWLHYDDARDTSPANVCSRFIAVCLDDGSWFRGASTIQCAFVSPLLNDNILGTQDVGAFVAGGQDNGTIYIEGTGTRDATAYLQTADFYLDNGRRRVGVQSIKPDFEQQTGDVDLTLYVRDTPQASEVTKGPYALTSGADKKDFRASGMLMSAKFSSAAGVKWRLGKPTFDCVTMGGR